MSVQYKDPQDIEDTMDLDAMKSLLTEAGVYFHHASREKTLAKLIYELHGKDKNKPQPGKITDDAVYADKVADIAKGILEEASKVKKSKPNKELAFIANAYNYNLPRKGINKKTNKLMRYVDTFDSLDIERQNKTGEVFKLPPLLFRGIVSGEKLEMGTFIGRSVLNTSNELLQEFLLNHRRYGSDFILYDKEEISRAIMVEDRKIVKLKSWIYEDASFDDLICVLTYIQMRSGASNYEQLAAITDQNRLRQQANFSVKNDPDLFLRTMQSKDAKFIHLVHKAHEEGVIKISRDKRSVILAENNKIVCESSITSDWENDLVAHLLTPEGLPLLRRMEERTRYYVI